MFSQRTAVTAARLRGLEKDLGLSGEFSFSGLWRIIESFRVDIEYQTVLAILYVTYCTLQVPSNMILNKVARPSLYVGTCVVLWGLVSALTGVSRILVFRRAGFDTNFLNRSRITLRE
jgi:hypothetical protein